MSVVSKTGYFGWLQATSREAFLVCLRLQGDWTQNQQTHAPTPLFSGKSLHRNRCRLRSL